MSIIDRLDRRLLPLIILFGFLLIAALFYFNEPAPARSAPARPAPVAVDVMLLTHENVQIKVESYGTVQPRTQSMLVAQISGQITKVNSAFRDGGFFNKNDVLLEIDPRDYIANVKIAEASLVDAQQVLMEETARAEQASKDWKRLGRGESPSDLVLRKPQMLAAKARLASASANLDKVRLDLERTKIRAPYAGRTLKNLVDLGQVVSMNAQLGEIYATDAVEIRLPIRNRDLAYVSLPEQYTNSQVESGEKPKVVLTSQLTGDESWDGEIVRTESAIDTNARQLHVVAKIDRPFEVENQTEDSKPTARPIKIGEYVNAFIAGKLLENVLSIPVDAIYQNSYVYIVVDGLLQRRNIDIAWNSGERAIIQSGLEAGDQLVLTPLGQVTSGVRVSATEYQQQTTAEANDNRTRSRDAGT
ncbi:MAG: efflux RND transporter periplasmic adaptor subunit [Pseudomonadota bacterium]